MGKFKFQNIDGELYNLLDKYEENGWDWIERACPEEEQPSDNYFHKASLEYIIDPYWNVWSVKDCLDAFKGVVEIGNNYQIEALKVLDFVNLLFNLFGPDYVGYDSNFNKL